MARLEDKMEKAILPLTEMYSQIEMDLLIKIARHFSIKEEFMNSDYWRIKKLDEMGLFNSEVVDYIARYSSKTNEEVLKALEKIGAETVNFDKLNHLFEDEVLKVDPIVLKDNYAIRNIINFAYNELSNRFIEMSSKIEQSAREAYLNVVEQAYLKTSMGTHSYQEAIRSAVDELGNKGITTLTYTTKDKEGNIVGIRGYDVTSTIRREVLTATRQLSNNINMEVAEELECEYLYLSEHIRCRPEHFDWQGTIIKKEELVPVTDYGSITGLAGINCAHYFEPYFGDARGDELKQISKEDATQQYELSQKQRYLERGIRKWKRKKEMFKAIDDKEKYNESKFKVKEWQQRLNKFTEDNNLRRDYTREHVYENKDITQEWFDNLTYQEQRDLKEYISSGSYKINESLYSNKELTAEQAKMRNSLDTALTKIPKYQGIVNRSVEINSQEQLNNILSIFDNDKRTGSWGSYISSSKRVYDENMRLQFTIKSKNGRDISSLNNEGGGEILFERKTKFKYIDLQKKNGKIYISLEEIE